MAYRVNPRDRVHILVGDKNGGGHRFGAGKGRTEFPQGWSDDAIIASIEAVANDPASLIVQTKPARRYIVTGTKNGVVIVVIVVAAAGVIITGHPE